MATVTRKLPTQMPRNLAPVKAAAPVPGAPARNVPPPLSTAAPAGQLPPNTTIAQSPMNAAPPTGGAQGLRQFKNVQPMSLPGAPGGAATPFALPTPHVTGPASNGMPGSPTGAVAAGAGTNTPSAGPNAMAQFQNVQPMSLPGATGQAGAPPPFQMPAPGAPASSGMPNTTIVPSPMQAAPAGPVRYLGPPLPAPSTVGANVRSAIAGSPMGQAITRDVNAARATVPGQIANFQASPVGQAMAAQAARTNTAAGYAGPSGPSGPQGPAGQLETAPPVPPGVPGTVLPQQSAAPPANPVFGMAAPGNIGVEQRAISPAGTGGTSPQMISQLQQQLPPGQVVPGSLAGAGNQFANAGFAPGSAQVRALTGTSGPQATPPVPKPAENLGQVGQPPQAGATPPVAQSGNSGLTGQPKTNPAAVPTNLGLNGMG